MAIPVGILIANLFYFVLSATSLGAILLASWELFFLIKWLDAGYLIWLGLKTFFTRRDDARHAEDKISRRCSRKTWYICPGLASP